MKLLYFYRVPVPEARADAIQIVNTCAGIVRAGGDVDLHRDEDRVDPPERSRADAGEHAFRLPRAASRGNR